MHYPRHGKPAPTPGVCDPTLDDDVRHFGETGWSLSSSVVYRVNYSSIPSSVSNANARTAIRNSFQVWQNQTGGKVTFTEGAPTSIKSAKYDGVRVVAWGNVRSPNAIAVTYTWYTSSGQVLDQDTIMNARLPWAYSSVRNPDETCGNLYSYDAQNILTHEIGHWMGLDDLYESVDQDLTMYGYGDKGELKKDTLGKGDRLGIAELC